MNQSIVFEATCKINDSFFSGTVSSIDLINFVWVNKSSDLDLYFPLKKISGKWIQTEGGQQINYPQKTIDEIGNQIDKWLLER